MLYDRELIPIVLHGKSDQFLDFREKSEINRCSPELRVPWHWKRKTAVPKAQSCTLSFIQIVGTVISGTQYDVVRVRVPVAFSHTVVKIYSGCSRSVLRVEYSVVDKRNVRCICPLLHQWLWCDFLFVDVLWRVVWPWHYILCYAYALNCLIYLCKSV